MWCAMSILVPVLAWRLGRLLFNPAAAALTAILCAFWPPFIVYGGYFLSEIPSLVFLLAALVLGHQAASRQGRSAVAFAVAAGLLGGASVAIRPAFVLNLGLLGLVLIGRNLPKLITALAFAAAAAVPIGGAMGISAAAAGEYVGINTNSAITFYAGHCPVRLITMEWRTGNYFVGAPPTLQQNRGRDVVIKGHPPTDQEYFFNEGMECVRKNGWGHARIVLRNIADLGATSDMWPPADEPTLRRVLRPFNVAYSLAILPIVAISLVSVWRQDWAARRSEALMAAHLYCVLATGIFFLGDPRYRMPYDVFGLVLAASLIARLFWRDEAESPAQGAVEEVVSEP
jgi:4-amino-4-deoxy-L-arabinose transferase-like glycosyltransferase